MPRRSHALYSRRCIAAPALHSLCPQVAPTTDNTVTQTDTSPKQPQKQRPFVDLIISIVLPSIILMKFSGDDKLGATTALIVALAFPIGYGLYEWIVNGKRNTMAALGVVSVILTGGIGLMKLDAAVQSRHHERRED